MPLRNLLLLLPASVAAHGSCGHDATAKWSGGVRNLGYSFNKAVPYASKPSRGRQTSSNEFVPIRISLDFSAGATGMTAEKQSFLQNTLLPDAIEWIQASLSVVPVTGTLKYARTCAHVFQGGTCHTEGPAPTCGASTSGGDYAVPSALLDSLETCATCFTGPTPCTGCSTTPAGAGALAADFVLFVSSVATSSCSSSTIAYASTCQRDQNDRPIFGMANFCPAMLSTAAADYASMRATAIHEVLHALGFSSGSWPLFRQPDGTPMTARELDGLPATTSATCADGSTRSNVLEVSSSTLQVASGRGGATIVRLVTPRVASVARDVFGCATLTGAELENQPTGSGCYGSHWEQRNWLNELMAAVSSHAAVYSALTLAALHDSGWYVANYSATGPLLWGRSKGCSFINDPCVSSSGAHQPGFCSTPGEEGCTPDFLAKGHCHVATYSADLPAPFRYFADPRTGGASQTADFCPYFAAYSNGACSATVNAPSANYRAETFGSGARCFSTSLSQVAYRQPQGPKTFPNPAPTQRPPHPTPAQAHALWPL